MSPDPLLGDLLDGALPVTVPAAGRNPSGWPGYQARAAVRVLRASGFVAAIWDFSAYGGSFGEDDATALVAAADLARHTRSPLVTVVRSGGTRLQEGMSALVGIPRARLALLALSRAGVPHLSVADAPTTGGVWVSVASGADLRAAVAGATVGFAGPRVVEAVTGSRPAEGSHTAESAAAAGLVDAALPGAEVARWVRRVLAALTPDPQPVAYAPEPAAPDTGGWEQIQLARARTTGGREVLGSLLTDRVDLAGRDGTVAAALGRWGGRPVVAVAVAADVGVRPTPAGYRLAARAYGLADRLGLPVLSLVDNVGAEPGQAAEEEGIAPAMGAALDALLTCRSPTLALVHGEGGSGGAIATASADRVLLTRDAYFAAIGPEGAAAALRRPPEECAELLRVTPADLLHLGAADALVSVPQDALAHLATLEASVTAERLAERGRRWSGPLPGTLAPLGRTQRPRAGQ